MAGRRGGNLGHVVAELSGRLMAVEERARERDLRIREMQKRVAGLEAAVEARDARIAGLEAENDTMRRTLSYCQNANTPPSSALPGHKRRKRKVRRARERGELPPHGMPGGRPGHRGTSRRHAPTEEVMRAVWVLTSYDTALSTNTRGRLLRGYNGVKFRLLALACQFHS